MKTSLPGAGSPVPLIDLAPWFDGDLTSRATLARTVDQSLQTSGFLLVANHRVPPAVLAGARTAAHELFALPLSDKGALAVGSDAYRGWAAQGTEATAASYGVATLPDLRESFTIGPIDRPDDDYHRRGGAVFAPNRWPQSLPRFQDAWLTLYRSFETLAGTLTVNTGDLMALWSGYRWTSTRHRVLPPSVTAPDEELLSLIFFHEPDDDAVIRPLAAPDGEAAPDITVIASQYLQEKLDAMILKPGA